MAAATQQRLEIPGIEWREPRSGGHLDTPLTKAEQRRIQRLYVENRGLVCMFAARLSRQYRHCLDSETVDSCVDFAFIKAARMWDPEKGKLSTILGVYATGEVKHYIRDRNWTVKAPGDVRQRGMEARRLLESGMILGAVARQLGCSSQDVKDSLIATTGTAHDVLGFDLHVCQRPTPWEVLEAQET